MKRIASLFLLFALLAALVGCGGGKETPSVPDAPTPPADNGFTLAELNVEFVSGERDTEDLLQLKQELPPLLIGALAEQNVHVDKVNITFGASEEATAEALARGAVQIGFVPTELYLAHEDELLVTDVSLSPEIVAFGIASSEYGEVLREKNGEWSWDDLARATWALPQDENSFAVRWANAFLDLSQGKTVSDLPHVIRFIEGSAPTDEPYDLFVSENAEPFIAENLSGAEVFPYFFSSVTVVSAADDILSTDEFLAALSAAVNELSGDEDGVLYAYNGTRYGYIEQETLESCFDSWRLIYNFEHKE